MKETYYSCNILSMEIEGNYDGQNSGDHGGHVSFCLDNERSTAWNIYINDQRVLGIDSIRIELTGCTEFETFTEAINDAAHYLVRKMIHYYEKGGD